MWWVIGLFLVSGSGQAADPRDATTDVIRGVAQRITELKRGEARELRDAEIFQFEWSLLESLSRSSERGTDTLIEGEFLYLLNQKGVESSYAKLDCGKVIRASAELKAKSSEAMQALARKKFGGLASIAQELERATVVLREYEELDHWVALRWKVPGQSIQVQRVLSANWMWDASQMEFPDQGPVRLPEMKLAGFAAEVPLQGVERNQGQLVLFQQTSQARLCLGDRTFLVEAQTDGQARTGVGRTLLVWRGELPL